MLVLSCVLVVLSYRPDLSLCWFPIGVVLISSSFIYSFFVCPFVSVCSTGEACELVESIQSRCDLEANPLHKKQRPDGRCYRPRTNRIGCFDTEVLQVIVSLSIDDEDDGDVVAMCCSLYVFVCVCLCMS